MQSPLYIRFFFRHSSKELCMGLHTHTDVLAHIFLRQSILQNSSLHKAGLFVYLSHYVYTGMLLNGSDMHFYQVRCSFFKFSKRQLLLGAVSVRQLYYIWKRS